jgi:hypothetical protein
MGEPSPPSAAARAANRDLLGRVERFEMLLDAGFVRCRTGSAALLVTKRRLLWRLVEPEPSPVLSLAFEDVRSVVVDDGMGVRLVCRPEGGRLDVHGFEFQSEDAGLRLMVLDWAAHALLFRRGMTSSTLEESLPNPNPRPQLFLINRQEIAE